MERVAPVGLWLVVASQVTYVIGSFGFGGPGIGTLMSAISVGCAAACAMALSRGDRNTFAWGMLAFAVVQLIDYLANLGNFNPFFVGFTLLVVGLGMGAAGAQRWRKDSPHAPRPQSVRFGAGLASLGSFTYLVGGFLGGNNFGFFTVGALLAGAGWALVALS